MLTEQKRRFAYQLAVTEDKAAAAKFVGIDDLTAQRWASDPEVLGIIARDREANNSTLEATGDRIKAYLLMVMGGNIADYFHPSEAPDGESAWLLPKPLHDLTESQQRRIKKIKPTQYGFEYELHDPVRAALALADIYGLKDDKATEHNPEDLASQLREAAAEMERVSGAVN